MDPLKPDLILAVIWITTGTERDRCQAFDFTILSSNPDPLNRLQSISFDTWTGINMAMKALADPKSACSKIFNSQAMKVSADTFLATLLGEANIGFTNSTDQLRDRIGGLPAFDGVIPDRRARCRAQTFHRLRKRC